MLESASRASSDLRPATGPRFLSTRLWVSCLSSSHVRVGAICAAAEMAASNTTASAIAVWRTPKRRSIENIVFFLLIHGELCRGLHSLSDENGEGTDSKSVPSRRTVL